MEDGFDLDHAIFGVAAADVTPLQVTSGVWVLAMTLHEGVLARQLLELRGGHEACVVEQQGFVGRRRDAHHRAYLRVRDFAAPERIVDRGELGELIGDAHALPGRDGLPADPPRQPVCTRQRALDVPAAALIKLAEIREEPVHGGIEVCGLFCDAFAELLQIAIHGDLHSI